MNFYGYLPSLGDVCRPPEQDFEEGVNQPQSLDDALLSLVSHLTAVLLPDVWSQAWSVRHRALTQAAPAALAVWAQAQVGRIARNAWSSSALDACCFMQNLSDSTRMRPDFFEAQATRRAKSLFSCWLVYPAFHPDRRSSSDFS